MPAKTALCSITSRKPIGTKAWPPIRPDHATHEHESVWLYGYGILASVTKKSGPITLGVTPSSKSQHATEYLTVCQTTLRDMRRRPSHAGMERQRCRTWLRR